MKEKPILFSTPMVQGILRDVNPKTQTRRVVPLDFKRVYGCLCANGKWSEGIANTIDELPNELLEWYVKNCISAKYQAGDTLWVRETFFTHNGKFYYKADNKHLELEKPGFFFKWKPSIHMPHTAARIFLRVINVRTERLRDITLEDIEHEGFYCDPEFTDKNSILHYAYRIGMRIHFRKYWDSLHTKKGYGWDKDPWVWVYEFEVERR